MTSHSAPILPGATIGFLGGGQLGRMTAMAARSMGYDVRVLDPDAECSAKAVASHTITAPWSDAAAAATLGRHSDVVTLEIEQIPLTSLEAVAAETRLHPGPNAVFVIQDRARQKEWLRAESFPLGDFRTVQTEAECTAAIETLGSSIVKSASGGYDGRGQVRVIDASAGAEAWAGVIQAWNRRETARVWRGEAAGGSHRRDRLHQSPRRGSSRGCECGSGSRTATGRGCD